MLKLSSWYMFHLASPVQARQNLESVAIFKTHWVQNAIICARSEYTYFAIMRMNVTFDDVTCIRQGQADVMSGPYLYTAEKGGLFSGGYSIINSAQNIVCFSFWPV